MDDLMKEAVSQYLQPVIEKTAQRQRMYIHLICEVISIVGLDADDEIEQKAAETKKKAELMPTPVAPAPLPGQPAQPGQQPPQSPFIGGGNQP